MEIYRRLSHRSVGLAILCCTLGLLAACGDEGVPAPECTGPSDCPAEQDCQDGVCVEPQDPCAEVSCAEGELCIGGGCFARSCAEISCREELVCLEGDCVSRECAGVSCPSGEACAAGTCYPRACGTESCEGGVCVDGACRARACVGVSCEDRQACANGACFPEDCASEGCAEGEVCFQESCTQASCVDRLCAPGTLCEQGVCREACRIDGALHAADEPAADNDCLACLPATDTLDWTPLEAGTACASDAFCTVATTCDGAGACGGGEPRDCTELDAECEVGVCDDASERCVAEPLAAGTSCGAGQACDGEGRCVSGCALPWGGTVAHGETVTAYDSATVACGASCASEPRTCDDGTLSGTFTQETCAESCAGCPSATLTWGTHGCQASFSAAAHGASGTETNAEAGRSGSATFSCEDGSWSQTGGTCEPAGCALPWGGSIAHLESVVAYEAGAVACSASCESETRTCRYGVLSGSYLHQSCAPQCASCPAQTLTWGAHGCQASFTAGANGSSSTEANVEAGRSGSATFSCDDGAWSLTSGTCDAASCSLPWGGSIAHLESVTAHESSAVACGGACVSETRRCSYGVLSGTYLHQDCSEQCAGCSAQTMSWGDGCEASVPASVHGEQQTADNATSGRSGAATFACSDGAWSMASGTCDPDGCALPWGGTLAHGQSVAAYENDGVPCGGTCVSEMRACSYGALSGSYAHQSCAEQCAGCPAETMSWGSGCEASFAATAHGDVSTEANSVAGRTGAATYACSDGAWSLSTGTCEPDACTLPWGGTLAHGQSVTAYQASTEPCGGACASETRTCSYGVLSGSYLHESCSVEACVGCAAETLTWGGYGCEGSLPAAAHGASADATNTVAGRTGTATWTCDEGSWSLSSGTCEADPCSLPWGGTLTHGHTVTAFSTSSVPCGGACQSETRTCSYGVLSGSYAASGCSEQCAGCPTQTLSWGTHGCEASFAVAAHGTSRTASNATDGRTGSATYLCHDGAWQYTSGTCEADGCSLPWGGTIAHDQSVTAYESTETSCADFCPDELRECSYGTLSGTFTRQSCSLTVGSACADGSIYAGAYGGHDYFTTPANLGTFSWNAGVNTWIGTGATSASDGRANTTLLAGLVDAASPYRAAVACHDLVAHGRADWFLPAEGELNLLWENRAVVGGLVAGDYWSSTERSSMSAWFQVFPDGWGTEMTKNGPALVRCVRR